MPKKYSPHYYTIGRTSQNGKMGHAFMLFTTNSEDRSQGNWSSANVAHLLQGLMYC